MAGRHDSVYKLLFSHPTFVQQLMQGFAPPDISQHLDYSTLTQLSGNYVTPALKKKLQDIVWSVTWRPESDMVANQNSDGSAETSTLYICILLEFQAKTDYDMPLRMLQYTTSFYQQHIKEKKLKLRKDKLPLVFPIVLYSGKAPWKAASAIQTLLMAYPKPLAPFQPRQHYYLIDEKRLSKALLFDQRSPLSGLFAIGNVNDLAGFKEAANMLIRAAKQHPDWPSIKQTIETVALYYLQQNTVATNIEPIDFEEVSTVKWIDREIEQNRQAALAQGIEKGMEKGIEKGREEGIEKGAEMTKLEMARRLLGKGLLTIEQIVDITGLKVEQVEQLKPQPN